ncbi:MAG TPA: hypothetical protein VHE12_10285 [bacterium]|nr:hypothetical protein [bacterium]
MPRKRGHEDDEDLVEDDLEDDDDQVEDDEDDEEDDDDDDTIDLDQAEEEEKEDEDDSDDDDEDGESVDTIERRRLFQNEAEELLENMTLEDVREVLRENELDESQAQRLRKLLNEVVDEGEVVSMDEAWEEALERLEEE